MDNFDPESTDKNPLDSPRSLEACKRQGIKPQEIIKTPKEEMKRKFLQEHFNKPDFFEEYYTHYEQRRHQKIEKLKNVRRDIIDQIQNEMTKS